MKIKFWLLDINPKMQEGQPLEMWLWGIDSEGNRVLVIDRSFVAYFYAVVKEGFNPSVTADKISSLLEPSVEKTEVVARRFFGKPVEAVKVYCRGLADVGKLARALRKLEAVKECLEDDIRAPMQYMIDNNLAPSTWLQADVEELQGMTQFRVAKIYVSKTVPLQLAAVEAPAFRILSLSMISYSREGSPRPDRNPVVIISTAASNGEGRQFVAGDDKDDASVIDEFVRYLRSFDPDVILSFGGNAQWWDYLIKRSHRIQRTFDVDRTGKEPHTSVYGHVSFTGMANVDLADFMDLFPEVKVQTLHNLASYLGVNNSSQAGIEDVEYADYWDDPKKRRQLEHFSLTSARNVLDCGGLLLDFASQLSSLVGLPLDHVMTAAVGFRVEWFLIKETRKIGELVPRRIEQTYLTYAGGLVLQPKPGLHDNIVVLDFKSMYPNIMLRYNLSPDTYISPGEPEPPGGVYVAPEVNHRFRKEPPGFYKEALTFLIEIRSHIRQQMKKLSPDSMEYGVLDARQRAVKIITNAAYGYAGWVGARWYIKPVAEAASAWGRYTILNATRLAEAKSLTVIYGDTDSLFLTNDSEKIIALKAAISEESGLEVEASVVYTRIFFTEAKKRYAGLRKDGSLDIVGMEVIRGDWAQVAKNVQESVLGIILREQSPKKAVEYVHRVVAELKQRKIPLHDLIIWKTLTKPPEQYAVRAAHVEAAKMLMDKGWKLTGGDKVGYVILAGRGRFYSRVKPYVFAKYEEVDVDYYVTNQVVPAAARILEFFGVTEEELESGSQQNQEVKSLTDYF